MLGGTSMVNQIINSVLTNMSPHLNSSQLTILAQCLIHTLHDTTISISPAQLPSAIGYNDSLLRQFAASKRLEGKSPLTIAQYLRASQRFLSAVNKHCTDITALDIKYYLSVYASTGVSSTTVHNELHFISAFFSWLMDEEFIVRNPAHKIKNIRKDTPPKYLLTDNDINQMHNASHNKRNQAIIDVLASTGLRVSELAALNRNSISPEGAVCVYATKTHSYRTVYLTPTAKNSLNTYLSSRTDHHPAVFLTARGHRITARNIEDIVHQTSVAAGIPHTITVHSIRRYLATALHRRGCPLTYVSRLLGHASTSMTEQYYIQLSSDDLQAAYIKYATQ